MSWIPAPEAHIEAGEVGRFCGIDEFGLAAAGAMSCCTRLADGHEVVADLQLVDPPDAGGGHHQHIEDAAGLLDQRDAVAVAAPFGRLEDGVVVLGRDGAAAEREDDGQRGEMKEAHAGFSVDSLTGYIGLPFLAKGRTRAGLDCWGLVRLVMAERLGLDLPAWTDGYDDIAPNARTAAHLRACAGEFVRHEPDVARPGDILLFRVGPDLAHVGLDIGGGRMLHIHEGINACVERWRGPRWLPRLEGAYRAGGGHG